MEDRGRKMRIIEKNLSLVSCDKTPYCKKMTRMSLPVDRYACVRLYPLLYLIIITIHSICMSWYIKLSDAYLGKKRRSSSGGKNQPRDS